MPSNRLSQIRCDLYGRYNMQSFVLGMTRVGHLRVEDSPTQCFTDALPTFWKFKDFVVSEMKDALELLLNIIDGL